LIQLGGKRITSSGVLIIKAQRYRTQEKNREDALKRLVELVRKAVEKPKSRRKTRPSQKSKEKRLERKRQRGQIKAARKTVTRFGE
jgi:ribosome-associated protein